MSLQNFTIDQAAGGFALAAGAVGSLLLVIWQSKCHCKINLCWLFQCERKPTLKDPLENPEGETEALDNSSEPEPEPPDILEPEPEPETQSKV